MNRKAAAVGWIHTGDSSREGSSNCNRSAQPPGPVMREGPPKAKSHTQKESRHGLHINVRTQSAPRMPPLSLRGCRRVAPNLFPLRECRCLRTCLRYAKAAEHTRHSSIAPYLFPLRNCRR